ncbi:MAG: AsmA family protein [Acidobacteriota bacterium]|nr:AsmA family protein [Acidobacteriota bacterium]
MQETRTQEAPEGGTRSTRMGRLRRYVLVYYIVLAILLLALLPPYVNVNRYQRQIATRIGASLGRPVHLDQVTLHLLPFPGFTLQNLVVSEDPAFGSEPVIRANSVEARLRVSSLWRRQVEFATISFTEPSVNLVRLPDGRWNLESILLQASRIGSAPTGQLSAGQTPRFPYVEATGARVNVKQGVEKMPLALTDAEFALWQSTPQEWKLRIEATPARTDTSATNTGTVKVEATLGRATTLNDVPLHMDALWSDAPMGAATTVLLGRDLGIRGTLAMHATLSGTLGSSQVETHLQLKELRRAEFIPEQPLSLDLSCSAQADDVLRSFLQIACAWPPAAAGTQPSLSLSASVPDVRSLETASLKVDLQGIDPHTLVDWLHVASSREPADLLAQGELVGHVAYDPTAAAGARWSGALQLNGASLESVSSGLSLLTLGDVVLDSQASAAARPGRHRPSPSETAPKAFVLQPIKLPLGGKDSALLEGTIDAQGYTLHLSGTATAARLAALAKTIPQFGDGLSEFTTTPQSDPRHDDSNPGPVHLDLTATRPWGGAQVWQQNVAHPEQPAHKHR